jgi:hypothetical protein
MAGDGLGACLREWAVPGRRQLYRQPVSVNSQGIALGKGIAVMTSPSSTVVPSGGSPWDMLDYTSGGGADLSAEDGGGL